MGYLQTLNGIGWMLGTVEGSIFYDIGGSYAYVLPFYINSCLFILVIPIAYILLPNN